ncbi:radical SAM family heme chaperone HemW [Nostocoides australiense]|nr:radical SAM family heme chaperone HemW [Tetrasphaera australiensis]HRW01385.1 radical SAM family heme chaperone HemW [Tetrasphaera sp.]
MPPSALPDGDPAPVDGRLPPAALAARDAGAISAYVHVPFCRVRCGYCDFNTYAPGELTGPAGSATAYGTAVEREIALAGEVLQDAGNLSLATVFVGGGTPTLLPSEQLTGIVRRLASQWQLEDDAEVTTEANPDSVTIDSLATLRAGGFTRVSFGMQSSVPHVLATLERTHDPANVAAAVAGARTAGLDVSLDLIYGTPGESLEDWRRSLEAAIALEPDHISAYALVVEAGTKLAAQVRRGLITMPDDDDEADKYELADELLTAAGYGWYEISNWARPGKECRHNLAYWRGGDWWGFGPGAHSHVGGVRWWNVKHPGAYADRLVRGASPAAAREDLTAEQRYDEQVLLAIRLAEGLPLDVLTAAGRAAVPALVDDGLLTDEPADAGRPRRVVLTLRGRLLTDTVVRALLR